MLFDLYTNYNLVSGKQYKQKLRPQNSQKKGYMSVSYTHLTLPTILRV